MARQPDIQYVRYYTTGSAAHKIEPERKPKRPAPVPQTAQTKRVRRDQRKVICIDPISLCAMVVAGAMLIAMVIGMMELGSIDSDAKRMESYVTQLRAENAELHTRYKEGYDLADVEQKALEMGLVPEDQVEHITIHVELPPQEVEPTAWERFCATVKELFA